MTTTEIADEIWRTRKIRVDRRKIGVDHIKRIGRYTVPIDVFEGVTAELKLLVVPEGGELPPEEELAAMEAAEAAAAAEAAGAAEAAAAATEEAVEAYEAEPSRGRAPSRRRRSTSRSRTRRSSSPPPRSRRTARRSCGERLQPLSRVPGPSRTRREAEASHRLVRTVLPRRCLPTSARFSTGAVEGARTSRCERRSAGDKHGAAWGEDVLRGGYNGNRCSLFPAPARRSASSCHALSRQV